MGDHMSIEPPSSSSTGYQYDRECRAALQPGFEALLDAAFKAGWDRQRALYELMYLASGTVSDDGQRN